jgi:hypothetical protein
MKRPPRDRHAQEELERPMAEERCANCRYMRRMMSKFECHRRSPEPYDRFRYRVVEILRAIGYAQYEAVGMDPSIDPDLGVECTEALVMTGWPPVEESDWCGEWRPRTDVNANAAGD